MTGSDVAATAVLAVVSVFSLSALTFLCLRCRKKSQIIHEENRLYDQQTFQREGSRFAVMRSKTVTKPNQITRQLPTAPGDAPAVEPVQISPVTRTEEEQPNYVNVSRRAQRRSTMEAMYVNPLAESDVYQNVDVITETAHSQNEEDNNLYDYENIFPPSLPVSEDGDDDYENSDFLEQVANQNQKQKEEEDYPDYENAETQPDMATHNT